MSPDQSNIDQSQPTPSLRGNFSLKHFIFGFFTVIFLEALLFGGWVLVYGMPGVNEQNLEENEESSEEVEEISWITYERVDHTLDESGENEGTLSVRFEYPSGWTIKEDGYGPGPEGSVVQGAHHFVLTSPSGSSFVYDYTNLLGFGGPYDVCDPKAPEGYVGADSEASALECVFVEKDGEVVFGRTFRSDLDTWLLYNIELEDGMYQYSPLSTFSYKVADENDLPLLDKIAITIKQDFK